MTTLTIRPSQRYEPATETAGGIEGVSLNKLIEELRTAALAAYDARTRFRALAAGADRNAALNIPARLDELDRSRRP
jgi:hypothetical protein